MRTPAAILVMASLAACATSSVSYEQAYRRCLHQPDYDETTMTACTIVIDARHTSAEDRAFALNNRAQARDVPDAIADLDAAIRLAPGIAKLHRNRGIKQGDPQRMIADFSEAIRLDPNYAVAWNDRGEAYATVKRYDLAIRDLDEAIRLAPHYVHPMYNPYQARAQAKQASGDRRGAGADEALSRRFFAAAFDRDIIDTAGLNAKGMRAWEPLIVK